LRERGDPGWIRTSDLQLGRLLLARNSLRTFATILLPNSVAQPGTGRYQTPGFFRKPSSLQYDPA
jgi:hypothetical protein